MRAWRWMVVGSALVAALACAKKRERPPELTGGCEGDGAACLPPGPIGGGGSGGKLDAAPTLDGEALTSVTGSVVLLSENFSTSSPYTAKATVSAKGVTGQGVSAPYDGMSFQLDDIQPASPLWFEVTPDSVLTELPTIQPFELGTSQQVELFVVRAVSIDTIYALLSVPEARASDRAHVILRFVDATSGAALSGVKVSHQGEVVAYDAAGTWSDVQAGTGEEGYAVIVNALAQSFRTASEVQFSAGSAIGGVDVEMRAGAVSFAEVSIQINP